MCSCKCWFHGVHAGVIDWDDYNCRPFEDNSRGWWVLARYMGPGAPCLCDCIKSIWMSIIWFEFFWGFLAAMGTTSEFHFFVFSRTKFCNQLSKVMVSWLWMMGQPFWSHCMWTTQLPKVLLVIPHCQKFSKSWPCLQTHIGPREP